MGKNIIQKIFESHSESKANVGDIIDVDIDVRVARDFGGANVVKNLQENNLSVNDPSKTFFTFDCNPGGCDQKYAANQQVCRIFARDNNIRVFDINEGIGTHIVIDENIVKPGNTIISTDSHANILGAIGAFGQGMGDKDISHAWAYGKVWFKVPPTIKLNIIGKPSRLSSPKDVVLKILKEIGANGLLGYAAEIYGDYIDALSMDGRITIASMTTEMGGIIILFPSKDGYKADVDAEYEKIIDINISDIGPMISRPGHPEDVISIENVSDTLVDSGFIGSCTNGRMEDMRKVADILKGRKIAPGRVLKIVPSTDKIWKQCLDEGIIKIFKKAGVLVGSAGCAGCAAGQIGQTGNGEVAISSGNRNYLGKQGRGDIYLASPSTVAASLISGYITTEDTISENPKLFTNTKSKKSVAKADSNVYNPPLKVEGKAWVVNKDNIDTDMIFHNRYLSITDIDKMGQYAFDNLEGYKDFAKNAKKGDIVVVGKNFGCGSSRQQAVDCFKSLGISVIIGESFGSIYERNAINNALPIITIDNVTTKIDNMDLLMIDYLTGEIVDKTKNKKLYAKPFSKVQLDIYKKNGLLKR